MKTDNKNRVKQTLWISPEHSEVLKELDKAFPDLSEMALSEKISVYNGILLSIIQKCPENKTNNE